MGLGASALIHLLLLLIARFTYLSVDSSRTVPPVRDIPQGLQLEQVVIIDAPSPPTSAEPPPEEPPPPPQVPTVIDIIEVPTEPTDDVAPGGPAAAPAEPGPRTAAERLQPWPVDPRLLLGDDVVDVLAYTEEMELRNRVAATLRAWSDSVIAAEEAARRALDWTITDSKGRRWGVTPEGVYVMGIRIPVPVQFLQPPGRRDEARALERGYAEIQQQVDAAIARSIREERTAEIRARRDQERSQTRGIAENAPPSGSSSGASNGEH